MSQTATSPQAPQVSVTRRVRFAAAHYLRRPHWGDAQNLQAFGPSSNAFAHGHNYTLDVTITGPVDPATGMVVNLKDVKSVLTEEVIAEFDFKNINEQVPFFKTHLSTLENLAHYLWPSLQRRFEALGLTMSKLTLYEADDLYVEYFGGADALTGELAS